MREIERNLLSRWSAATFFGLYRITASYYLVPD